MTTAGWEHTTEFLAFSSHQPGTKRIVVGEASNPHRCMFNHRGKSQEEWDSGANMNFKGWSHLLSFWAFSSPQPGTIRIVVGECTSGCHRAMVNHSSKCQSEWNNPDTTMDCAGWTHLLEFWAFPPTVGSHSFAPNPIAETEQKPTGNFIYVPVVDKR